MLFYLIIQKCNLFKGTKEECDERENEILQYNHTVDQTLKKNISKEPSAKKSAKQNDENRETCRIVQLENLLSAVKSKLEEAENKVLDLETKLATANSKINQLEKESNSNRPDASTIEKLVSVSVSILSSFGTKEIVQSISLPNAEIGPKQVYIIEIKTLFI